MREGKRLPPLSPYKPLGPEPFAPHDMRIGAKIIDALDEAIRLSSRSSAERRRGRLRRATKSKAWELCVARKGPGRVLFWDVAGG